MKSTSVSPFQALMVYHKHAGSANEKYQFEKADVGRLNPDRGTFDAV
jgi:hypothetical protein